MQFEFYVLNSDFNTKKPFMYNIFNNIRVQECCEKQIKKYLRSPSKYKYTDYRGETTLFGFDALCEEIKSIIMWQEWSRCEYEIDVKDMFSDEYYKWDCYQQAAPNIKIITRDVIRQYKEQLKEIKNGQIAYF